MRLDDFWVMHLVRCVSASLGSKWVSNAVSKAAPEEVIRRAKYRIRRQRCRSLTCSRVNTDGGIDFAKCAKSDLRSSHCDICNVCDIADRTNPEETSAFRPLLAHSLAPSALLSVGEPSSTKDEEPPKKRSRPNTPDEVWTNGISGEGDNAPDGLT